MNHFQTFVTIQSHIYCASGTFLLSSGYQKISTQILYSLSISLLCMLHKQLLTEVDFTATANTRAQQMQVSCLRAVNVDFPKSSYKRTFSCNLDAKYIGDRLLQRNFSRADSG